MKRIFIIHGWSGSPKRDFIPWLTKELLERGYQVEALKMPLTYTPPVWLWMLYLRRKVGVIDENTYFIGHSLGTRATMFLLQSQNNKAGGALLVGALGGGWNYVTFPYNFLISLGARLIIIGWLLRKIDFKKVKANLIRSTVILSEDDYLIPVQKNKQAFEEGLNPKMVILKNKGHFAHVDIGDGTPEILEEALEMLKE